ncbi:MAG: hypothetical protein EPO24_08230 [Bacteroidetes bacterium]|nr:MAG: hypothetical protein EPO24_08230 [Bacteroidota bacterium]
MNNITKPLIIIVIVLVVVLCAGCEKDDIEIVIPPSATIPDDYPTILSFSQERLNNFYQQVESFRRAYNVTPVQVDSVLCTADYGVGNLFDVTPDPAQVLTKESAQDTLFRFLARWGHLFNAAPYELTVQHNRFDPGSNIIRIDYIKEYLYYSSEPFDLGYLRIDIKTNGIVQRITGNCAPTYSIPYTKRIDFNKAFEAIKEKKLYFYDWGGKDSMVLSPSLIEKAIVVPTLTRNSSYSSRSTTFEYRLCWKFKVPVFFVYVDAITGKDLQYTEQYVIF